jgi:hypothetical protein
MEARSVIEVVEYDEAWPVRAAAARADLISLGVFDAVEPGRRGRGRGRAGRAGLPPVRGRDAGAAVLLP